MQIIATSPEFQKAADLANALFAQRMKDPAFIKRLNTETQNVLVEVVNQLIHGKEPSKDIPDCRPRYSHYQAYKGV